MARTRVLRSFAILATVSFVGCHDPARPGNRPGKPTNPAALCVCKPTHITKDDWRIELKNGSLPEAEPLEITVGTVLTWPEGPEPGPRAPRFGHELTLYRIPTAYLQTVFFRSSDCDLHLEISEEPSKNAPRMIVETPGTPEYCSPRSALFADLQKKGITVTDVNQEITQPFKLEVKGVAFRDQAHPVWFARGSAQVVTLWELHPATVKLLP